MFLIQNQQEADWSIKAVSLADKGCLKRIALLIFDDIVANAALVHHFKVRIPQKLSHGQIMTVADHMWCNRLPILHDHQAGENHKNSNGSDGKTPDSGFITLSHTKDRRNGQGLDGRCKRVHNQNSKGYTFRIGCVLPDHKRQHTAAGAKDYLANGGYR